jgi:endonuclease/exonuclease/phosphatase family metal-dependent hydrolase
MKKAYIRFFVPVIKFSAVMLIIALLLGLAAPYINPYHFWPAAFMGLAYPLIWIFCLGCLLLLIGSRKWLIIMTIVIIFGTPMMLRHFSLPLKPDKSKPGDYKILTYNVHGFAGTRDGRSSYDRQKLIHDFINKANPTVVCIQEYAMKSMKHARYMKHLNEELKLPFKYLSAFDMDSKSTSYTFLIASDFPIVRNGNIFTMEYESCGIFSDIRFPEGIIRVYNIHLQSVKLLNEKKLLRPQHNLGDVKYLFRYIKGIFTKLRNAFPSRAYEAWMIKQSIRDCPYPVIIAGDFNDTPASYSYGMLSEGMKDAAPYHGMGFHKTYAESLYPIRIDHLLFDKRLQTGSYVRTKIYLSDHLPVMAGFRFKNKH